MLFVRLGEIYWISTCTQKNGFAVLRDIGQTSQVKPSDQFSRNETEAPDRQQAGQGGGWREQRKRGGWMEETQPRTERERKIELLGLWPSQSMLCGSEQGTTAIHEAAAAAAGIIFSQRPTGFYLHATRLILVLSVMVFIHQYAARLTY